MTKRYQVRRALGGGDSGDPGDLQGAALGRFEAAKAGHGGRLHADKSLGNGGSLRWRLGGDVHHADAAFLVVVGKSGLSFWHARDSSTGPAAGRAFKTTGRNSRLGPVLPTEARDAAKFAFIDGD